MKTTNGDEPTLDVVPMDLGEALEELAKEATSDEQWALALIAESIGDEPGETLESAAPLQTATGIPPVPEVTMELQDLDIEDAWVLELLEPEDQLAVCKALLERPSQ